MPRRVSSEFFIGFIWIRVESLRAKILDSRIVETLHLVRRADGDDAAFTDDRDAVGDAKGQVAVM